MSELQFGMIGLGTMGRNFLLNVADSGFATAGYDLDPEKRRLLIEEGAEWNVKAAETAKQLVEMLAAPRSIMLLVPAGPIVDSLIEELLPLLSPDDLIIDGGNSHFSDTERRELYLKEKGIGFMGVGVSGGEEGARNGASIMPGGEHRFYERIAPVLESVAAKVGEDACMAYIGRGGAGHFVKMVHNGIEYAMMQILAEAYDLMHRGLGLSHKRVGEVFEEWNKGEAGSFLVEISGRVLQKGDDLTGNSLVEMILDTAGQKGTGVWTSKAALDLGIAVPTIDAAVTMRQISSQKHLRRMIAEKYDLTGNGLEKAAIDAKIAELHDAVMASFISAFTQGFSLMQEASKEFGYSLDLAEIAKIWRGGCIIRAKLLEDIRAAFSESPELPNLMLNKNFTAKFDRLNPHWNSILSGFVETGIPAMAISTAKFYCDAMASERLPANLIQAQRDLFGAHTYQRIDKDGVFHTDDW